LVPLKDILLHLDSYPDPTPLEGVGWAISLARLLQARLTALAVKVRFPVHSNRMADYLIGLGGMVREEEAKSAARCHDLLQTFEARARATGVFDSATQEEADIYDVGSRVAGHARTRDLCVLPLAARADTPGSVAETVVFESGRPVVVVQPGPDADKEARLDTVVVAWDGSRPAARALADALPILGLAKTIHILTILHEKEEALSGLGIEAARHLRMHGIEAKVDEIDANGAPIGTVLEKYVKSLPADLLVMGAYGHSRVREFLLGGATRSVLRVPPIPVLLSH
jgi:nucleotide-binding universal stress UspA family protein